MILDRAGARGRLAPQVTAGSIARDGTLIQERAWVTEGAAPYLIPYYALDELGYETFPTPGTRFRFRATEWIVLGPDRRAFGILVAPIGFRAMRIRLKGRLAEAEWGLLRRLSGWLGRRGRIDRVRRRRHAGCEPGWRLLLHLIRRPWRPEGCHEPPRSVGRGR